MTQKFQTLRCIHQRNLRICIPGYSSLKQHPFIILQFYRSEDWTQLSYLLMVSQGQNQCVGQSGAYGEGICFQDHSGFGRIQYFTVTNLKSPFSCWLQASGHSGVLEATCIPYSGPLCLQMLRIIDFCYQPEGSCDEPGSSQIISLQFNSKSIDQ